VVIFLSPLDSRFRKHKGSQGHTCVLPTTTESCCVSRTCSRLLHGRFLFSLSTASGRLRCSVTDVPPQPNSPSGRLLETREDHESFTNCRAECRGSIDTPMYRVSHTKRESHVNPFIIIHDSGFDSENPKDGTNFPPNRPAAAVLFPFYEHSDVASSGISLSRDHQKEDQFPPMLHPTCCCPQQTRVKLNRVFFPR